MRSLFLLHCVLFTVGYSSLLQLEISQGPWKKINLSDHISNVTSLTSIVFDVEACKLARIILNPVDRTAASYRFVFDNSTGRHRKCFSGNNCNETEEWSLESCCNEYKTYWTKITESGQIMAGKGCLPGSDVLNDLQNDGPFHLRDIVLQSEKTSKWRIWQEQCNETPHGENGTTHLTREIITTTAATTTSPTTLDTITTASTTVFDNKITTSTRRSSSSTETLQISTTTSSKHPVPESSSEQPVPDSSSEQQVPDSSSNVMSLSLLAISMSSLVFSCKEIIIGF